VTEQRPLVTLQLPAQAAHAPPPAPQVLSDWEAYATHVLPLQHPLGHDAALHTHVLVLVLHTCPVVQLEVQIPGLPFVQVVEGPHGHVTGNPLVQAQPSFGLPLQLASLPESQVSAAAGSTCPTQVEPTITLVLSADKVHVFAPGVQDPVLLPVHGTGLPRVQAVQVESRLSTVPLQSLSSVELQSRVDAVTVPVQAPQVVVVLSADKMHERVPALQMPVLLLPGHC